VKAGAIEKIISGHKKAKHLVGLAFLLVGF